MVQAQPALISIPALSLSDSGQTHSSTALAVHVHSKDSGDTCAAPKVLWPMRL